MRKKKEVNPELESKLQQSQLQSKEKDKRERRTDEEIKTDKILIIEPNPLFIPVLKIPFDLWGDSQGTPELKLSDTEVKTLALPVTQLVNYYLPKMPVIAYAWSGLILSIFGIMQPRLKIIKDKRKEKEPQKDTQGQSGLGKPIIPAEQSPSI